MIKLSVIVINYNMIRELPRTIESLSPVQQKGIAEDEYEIIIVDNGSAEPFNKSSFKEFGNNIKLVELDNPTCSPVEAVNLGLSLASGNLCGVFIDGARMASPGLLANCLLASKIHDQPIITTIGFHLGPTHQSRASVTHYDQLFEDYLLASIDWRKDPYRLFKISCYAGSSPRGWFGPVTESNAIFLLKPTWESLGGYDPLFKTPGGGLSNLDLFNRAIELSPDGLIILLGEGTFHQYHGGTSSNAEISKWDKFHSEYQLIRGKPWKTPQTSPRYFGSIHPFSMKFIEQTVKMIKN